MRIKDILSSMLFSQTVGIANNHPECSFASPHSNVSCEALVRGGGGKREEGGGGGDRRCCGMGVGSTVGLYSRTFLCNFGSAFQFACPPL